MSAYDEFNDDGFAEAPAPVYQQEDETFEEPQPQPTSAPLLDDDFVSDGPVLPPPSAMEAEESLLLRSVFPMRMRIQYRMMYAEHGARKHNDIQIV